MYDLSTQYDSRNSFYGKAKVMVNPDPATGDEFTKTLLSYNTPIAAVTADAKVDLYNYDLLKWVADDLGNAQYVDDAIDEGLANPEGGLFGMLTAGQYKFHSDNFYELLEEYRELLEAAENNEEESEQ